VSPAGDGSASSFMSLRTSVRPTPPGTGIIGLPAPPVPVIESTSRLTPMSVSRLPCRLLQRPLSSTRLRDASAAEVWRRPADLHAGELYILKGARGDLLEIVRFLRASLVATTKPS
jgi:hypothetical protein